MHSEKNGSKDLWDVKHCAVASLIKHRVLAVSFSVPARFCWSLINVIYFQKTLIMPSDMSRRYSLFQVRLGAWTNTTANPESLLLVLFHISHQAPAFLVLKMSPPIRAVQATLIKGMSSLCAPATKTATEKKSTSEHEMVIDVQAVVSRLTETLGWPTLCTVSERIAWE